MENESDGDIMYNLHTRKVPQRFGKGAGRAGNWRMNRDHPNYSLLRSARILRRVLDT